MNLNAILLALGAAVFTHTASFRVGSKRVSAFDVGGNPVHLTFADALKGAEMALLGQEGDFQTGTTKIVIDAWPV